jgi:cysteinyl-tRNA synthetase
MLTVGGAKMAKSDGNFITVRDALGQGDDQKKQGEIIRLALLSTHYRDPLDWTDDRLHQARQTLDRWYRALLSANLGIPPNSTVSVPFEVAAALDDDLNIPLAIARLHDLAGAINRSNDPHERGHLMAELTVSGQLMGLLGNDPDEWLRPTFAAQSQHIGAQIAARTLAREERRFADADRIRDELAAEGIILEDGAGGTTWRRA